MYWSTVFKYPSFSVFGVVHVCDTRHTVSYVMCGRNVQYSSTQYSVPSNPSRYYPPRLWESRRHPGDEPKCEARGPIGDVKLQILICDVPNPVRFLHQKTRGATIHTLIPITPKRGVIVVIKSAASSYWSMCVCVCVKLCVLDLDRV